MAIDGIQQEDAFRLEEVTSLGEALVGADEDVVHPLTAADLEPEPALYGRTHPLLGELLIRQAGISPDQVASGLETQAIEGGRLGEILIRTRIVSEEQVLQALATQLNLPYLEAIVPDEVELDLIVDLPIHHGGETPRAQR